MSQKIDTSRTNEFFFRKASIDGGEMTFSVNRCELRCTRDVRSSLIIGFVVR
jgi:hypothetical protein